MRERWGQDFCQVCGNATTYADPQVPVCGSALCQAAWRTKVQGDGLAGQQEQQAGQPAAEVARE